MFSQVALLGIHGYQRWLSPRKGYRCAYSVRHGGTGCSGYAKFAIRDHGIVRAIPLIRARFAACRVAADAFASEREDEEPKPKRKAYNPRNRKKGQGSCLGDLYLCVPGGGVGTAGRAGASKTCDTNPCDGDIGCGGCDVSVCSCGG